MSSPYITLILAIFFLGAVIQNVYTRILESYGPHLGRPKPSVMRGMFCFLILLFGTLFSFTIDMEDEILFLAGMVIFRAIVASSLLQRCWFLSGQLPASE